jgi:capsular polysaccharide biosynthesis protein
MTLELDQTIDTLPEIERDNYQTQVLSGKLVSFRYLAAALRRRKRVWIAVALIGLVFGTAFHVVVPRSYTAYSTLYLAHAPGTDDAVGMGNDLALLNNTAVAHRAIKLLREPSLDPAKFLGKAPGKSISDNVMVVTMHGPSYAEAVRRVNAVTTAYLAFRVLQYNAQDDAIVKGLNKQTATLQSQVNGLTNSINSPNTGSDQLTQLVQQRSQDNTEIANLQQTVQGDQLATVSIVQATRILTSGTSVYHSTVKLFVVDSLTGLGVGLVIGAGIVVLSALVSDRVRRREDVATLTGASVEVSAGPIRHPRSNSDTLGRRRSPQLGELIADPYPELRPVVRYLVSQIGDGSQRGLLTVAVDDVHLPAVALAATAVKLVAANKKVVLVDLTAEHVFEPLLKQKGKPVQRVELARNAAVTLFVPPRDLGPEDDRAAWELSAERWQRSHVVLALATVDVARGAWHLRNWDRAILTVTAGRSSPQRISGTAELLRASGVAVVSSILLDADQNDESVGLADVGDPWRARPLAGTATQPPAWK